MGKKHKKKTKSEKQLIEDAPSPMPAAPPSEPPLKLVLKVGAKTQVGTSDSYNILQENTAGDASVAREQHPKKKKKKKKSNDKRDKKKEKTAPKREYEAYESHGTYSEDCNSRDGTTMEEGEEDTGGNTEETTEEDMATENHPPKAKKALLNALKEKLAATASVTSEPPATTATPATSETPAAPVNKSVMDSKEIAVPDKTPLQKVLENLQRTLQRKDVECFFAWPVNDVIAPGYSSIIQQPMDFSTMKKKIDNEEYTSIDEYKVDLTLMCTNATVYNGADTIYYKAAKKILSAGSKIMKKERLQTLKKAYGYYEEGDVKIKPKNKTPKKTVDGDMATEDSSGVDGEAMETDDGSVRDHAEKDGEVEYNLEEETAEEILEQVLQAAKGAKDRLTSRIPDSKIGFLRQDKNGTTTLNLLNPDKPGQPDSRVVNLGMLTGRLSHGTGTIPGFREDKRNKVTPVSYLNYGAYSSFAPSFDSTFSNISKEESDLLYSTYGDETAYHYAKSLQDFVKDCGDYAVNLVDNLLDTLTTGEHSKTLKVLEEKHKEAEQMRKEAGQKGTTTEAWKKRQQEQVTRNRGKRSDLSKLTASTVEPEYDFESLKSLSDLGIDMSFLPTIEKDLRKFNSDALPIKKEALEVRSNLSSASALIGDLEKTQNERLSRKPPPHLSFTPGPSDQECEIAEKLTQQLLALTSKVTPSNVTTTEGVRRAMGIALAPTSSSPTPEESNSSMADPVSDPADGMTTSVPSSDEVAEASQVTMETELMNILEGSNAKS